MAGFIKIGDIKGECTDADHQDWIDLLSFSQSLHSPQSGATGVARRRGDVVLEDIHVSKLLDKSSPKLAEAVCNGKVFDKVELHLSASISDEAREAYYKYELKQVLVTSYSVSGATQSSDPPAEDISLNFEEIKVTYVEFDNKGKKKGNIEYTWKVSEGKK